MDINSQKYWDSLLEDEWLGVIESESNIKNESFEKKESKEKDSLNKRVINLINIWNLDFSIDQTHKRIDVYIEWRHIAEIYEGNYHILDFSTVHIWIEISDNYKRKWLWIILYEKYEEEFWLPVEEYSRQKSKHDFFISIWYIPLELINDETMETIDYNDELISYIWEWYSCRYIKE